LRIVEGRDVLTMAALIDAPDVSVEEMLGGVGPSSRAEAGDDGGAGG
jgi:hypothetical protein